MNLQPGDKVKFLNEKGGGIVVRIIDPSTAEVAIEEGFNVPVRISELIKVDPSSESEKMFDVNYSISPDPEPENSGLQNRNFSIKPSGQPAGIYLAFIPQNQKFISAGHVEVTLINHTAYDILYNVFQKTPAGYAGADYGSLGPESAAILDSLKQEHLVKWTDCVFQFMFHSDDLPELIPPYEHHFKIKKQKLDKEDNYIPSPFVPGNACTFAIYKMIAGSEPPADEAPVILSSPDTSLIKKHLVGESFAEVDLHIHALVEDSASLDNSQKLNIQLDYARRCIESGIASGVDKIIFIHGVGAGILKIELYKMLESYEFIEYYDAPIARYGIGATEVIIHNKKRKPQNY